MKILYDCTYLRNKQTGVDVTFISLIKNLLKIDAVNQYIILIDHRFKIETFDTELAGFKNFTVKRIICYYPLNVFLSAFFMPFYILFKKIDVYHNPYFYGPLFKISKVKVIITVHDLYHKVIPKKMNWFNTLLTNFFADPAIKKADKIIVISSQTKTDFIKFYNLPESRYILIYQSIDLTKNDDQNAFDEISKAQQIDSGKFILNIGKILPSKGVDDLIKSYRLLLDLNIDNYKIKLVFAGISNTKYFSEIKKLINEQNIPVENIIFLGYVTTMELVSLYKNARLYVLPSFYEGFGLTALEAMKYNCPVIVRNASSLPEVVGDAALLFNDINELAAEMNSLLSDETLRDHLIAKGQNQILKFSDNARAKQTLDIYTN